MKYPWSWAIVAVIPIICFGCGPVEQELKTSDWATSEDGVLSLRLLAHEPVEREASIVLMAELRNDGEDELTVFSPFRPAHDARRVVKIRRGFSDILYSGPIVSYMPGRGDHVSIAPGEVIEDSVELPMRLFRGLHWPGKYVIRYPYATEEYERAGRAGLPKKDGRTWRIESNPITVRRR